MSKRPFPNIVDLINALPFPNIVDLINALGGPWLTYTDNVGIVHRTGQTDSFKEIVPSRYLACHPVHERIRISSWAEGPADGVITCLNCLAL